MNRFDENQRSAEKGKKFSQAAEHKKRFFGKAPRTKNAREINLGIILTFLFSITDTFLHLLSESAIAHFFSDLYYEWNEKWRSGKIFEFFKHRKGSENGKRVGFRVRFAAAYESSILYRIIQYISERIIHSHVRIWGMGLFTLAFMMIFTAMVKYYFTAEILTVNLLLAAVLIVLSLPLVSSKKRLGEALMEGIFSRYLAIEILGLDETKYQKNENKSGGNYLVMLALSGALGLSTYFLSPFVLLMAVIVLGGGVLIMCYPELGIVTTLSLIPFSNFFDRPSLVLAVLLGISCLGYCSKLIRGKRVIRFELMDSIMVLFAVLLFMGGVFTSGGIKSFYSACMYSLLVCIYPLIVNAYIRKTWIYRGMKLVVISTSIMALLGVLHGGIVNSAWIDNTRFADIKERVGATFDNPNVLGVYLVIVFPIILSHIASSKRIINKFLYLACAGIVLLCTVMTWSRGAWIGIAVGTIIFLLMYNFRNAWLVLLGLVTSPVWIGLLPKSILDRLYSIVTMSDSSVIYRFHTWYGSLNMAWHNLLSGIGVGESAFVSSYPSFAVSGTETVMHSHSLYIEILVELGIFGFIVFGLIMLMFTQKCFACVKQRYHTSKSRALIIGGFSGIVGALVMGCTDYIWYNFRVFLIFWAIIALTVALVRVKDKESAKYRALSENNPFFATIDI